MSDLVTIVGEFHHTKRHSGVKCDESSVSER